MKLDIYGNPVSKGPTLWDRINTPWFAAAALVLLLISAIAASLSDHRAPEGNGFLNRSSGAPTETVNFLTSVPSATSETTDYLVEAGGTASTGNSISRDSTREGFTVASAGSPNGGGASGGPSGDGGSTNAGGGRESPRPPGPSGPGPSTPPAPAVNPPAVNPPAVPVPDTDPPSPLPDPIVDPTPLPEPEPIETDLPDVELTPLP